ncbi:MAG: hypothetical protein GSR85_05705 [Desulfurococcales archaeon]|nr:hypothetical protein [Desulfurococcales archaeon]
MSSNIIEEIEEERRRNLADIIRHAQWEAEMVRRMGAKWFEIRDKWLIEAWETDRELWKDSKIREALVKAILARDKLRAYRSGVNGIRESWEE